MSFGREGKFRMQQTVPTLSYNIEVLHCQRFSLGAVAMISLYLAIYFSSPFGRYPTFHTLASVGRKEVSVCLKIVSAVSVPKQIGFRG